MRHRRAKRTLLHPATPNVATSHVVMGVVAVGALAYLFLHKKSAPLASSSSVLVSPSSQPQGSPGLTTDGGGFTDTPLVATATATSGFDPSRSLQRPRALGAHVPATDITEPHHPVPRPLPRHVLSAIQNRGIFDEPYGWANPW